MYLFSLFFRSAPPEELHQCVWRELTVAVTCHSELAAACWLFCAGTQSVLAALPSPWGLLFTSPGCHSAVLQCHRQHSLSSGNFTSFVLLPINKLLITDLGIEGEKKKPYTIEQILRETPFFTFLQAQLQTDTSPPSFLTSTPLVFTTGSHFPSQCLQ